MRMADIDRPHLDAVILRVANKLRACVKSHWLTVQQCRRENVRIVALHPGGGINQIGEAGRVAFRETVTSEAFDLIPAIGGELFVVSIRLHALEEFAFEVSDGSDALECRHRAAQPIRLKEGVEIVNDAQQADAVIVNTCSFIDASKHEALEAIYEMSDGKATARKKGQKLIVAGCMSQRFAKDLPNALPEVDAFIGLLRCCSRCVAGRR